MPALPFRPAAQGGQTGRAGRAGKAQDYDRAHEFAREAEFAAIDRAEESTHKAKSRS